MSEDENGSLIKNFLLVLGSAFLSVFYISNAINIGLNAGQALTTNVWQDLASVTEKIGIASGGEFLIDGKLLGSGKVCLSDGTCLGECASGSHRDSATASCVLDAPAGTGAINKASLGTLNTPNGENIMIGGTRWIELDCTKVLANVTYIDKENQSYSPISESPFTSNDNYWAGARNHCTSKGMRLPTREEMMCIEQYKESIEGKNGINTFTVDGYWTATDCTNGTTIGNTTTKGTANGVKYTAYPSSCVATYNGYGYNMNSTDSFDAQVVHFHLAGVLGRNDKDYSRYVRCVK